MATERQVLDAIGKQHPSNGVHVFDGRRTPLRTVGERAPVEGGGAVLIFLDLDPDALGIRAGSIGLHGVRP